MRKIIAAINTTLDGFCDHTIMQPDEEIHQHYTDLLNNAGAILYGRVTYELMEFWRPFLKNPSSEKDMNDFAVAIDRVPKIVFSRSLKAVDWETARLSDKPLEQAVRELQAQLGNDVFVGSRSLIVALTNLNLIDEYQICVHPVVVGKGLSLFKDIQDRTVLKLLRTKTLQSGAVILYYTRAR